MVSPIEVGVRCGRCRAELEHGDLCCAVCGWVIQREAGQEQRRGLTVVRCTGCNAAVSYDVKAEAALCAFCGQKVAVEQVEDPPEQVQEVVPFSVDEERARAALRDWLNSRDWFTPGDLTREATVESLHPLWWAAWVCEAVADVTFAVDTDWSAGYAEWAPYAGLTTLRFDRFLLSASQGLTEEETKVLGKTWDLQTAAPPEDVHQPGVIESFQIERSAARAAITEQLEAKAAERIIYEKLPGSSWRNLKLSVLLKGLKTRRLALPAWVLAYRYRDRLYRVVIHGQDEKVITGTSPISWWRVLAAASLLAAAIVGFYYWATQQVGM